MVNIHYFHPLITEICLLHPFKLPSLCNFSQQSFPTETSVTLIQKALQGLLQNHQQTTTELEILTTAPKCTESVGSAILVGIHVRVPESVHI